MPPRFEAYQGLKKKGEKRRRGCLPTCQYQAETHPKTATIELPNLTSLPGVHFMRFSGSLGARSAFRRNVDGGDLTKTLDEATTFLIRKGIKKAAAAEVTLGTRKAASHIRRSVAATHAVEGDIFPKFCFLRRRSRRTDLPSRSMSSTGHRVII